MGNCIIHILGKVLNVKISHVYVVIINITTW